MGYRISHRGVLHQVAQEVGIKIPIDPMVASWDAFPHYELFCAMQLNVDMPYSTAHFDNAKLIARLSPDQVESITKKQLLKMGFVVGKSEA